jgi:agmatinase
VDAHCDFREGYEGFVYSHASIMYNALREIPGLKKLVQVGIRDFSEGEFNFVKENSERVHTFFDQKIKERIYEGESWKNIVDEIISRLPQKVHISFDIDGLDPKLCPGTGTPVQGGFETEQVMYLFNKLVASGKELIGFDLVEIGVGESDWNSNVGARLLFRMCNLLVKANS